MARTLAALFFAGAVALAMASAATAQTAKPAPGARPAAAAKPAPKPVAKAAPARKTAAKKSVARATAKAKPAPKAAPVLNDGEVREGGSDLVWTPDVAVKSAGEAISRCLERPPSEGCAHEAFGQCAHSQGRENPQVLSDCSGYARSAWDERLRGLTERLQTVIQETGRTRPSGRALAASQKRWQGWSQSDCEMQTQGSKGSALHGMEVNLCLADHAAPRVQELEQLEKLWRGK